MSYETVTVEIQGVSPLLMHNPQLSNPMNKFTKAIKEITAKGKKKTEADLEALAKLEFMGGLYIDNNNHPAIPGESIEGMIREGAKKSRKGKDVQCGIISDGVWALTYDGPKDVEKLWLNEAFRDYRPVGVKNVHVMRMRPRFNAWSLTFEVAFESEVLNLSDLQKWLGDAGRFSGLGDYRPRFGRFDVVSVN